MTINLFFNRVVFVQRFMIGMLMLSLAAPLTAYSTERNLPEQADWHGIARDTAYFTGWQFIAVAALYQAPESITSWSDDEKSKITTDKWSRNTSNPVWDQDQWYLNYVLHPYWGATYYTRARERGLDRTDSLLISALWSSIFEFGAEALFEPTSKQDLIVTPLAGTLLGEYVFTPLREKILAKSDEPAGWDKALLILTDPFYYLNNWTDQLLHAKTNVSITIGNPSTRASNPATNATQQNVNGGKAITVNLRMQW